MNKAYRHVYKDGIGWVAIAENGSCVSSSKGSGTVSSKTKVEVLKNFFDLRNSVVLNNGFLLKGLFAATLFCGVFVSDLKALSEQEIANIQNNGTTVYTGNDGYRMEKVVNPNGSIGFKGKFDKSIIDRIDSNGVVEIGGRHFVIPTGSLLKDKSQLTEKDFIFFEVVKDGSGNWRGKTFREYKAEGKTNVSINLDREVVQYDAQEKKWYMHNHAETSPFIKEGRKLYYGKKENGEFGFATWNYLAGIPTTNPKDKDGIGNPEMIDGYYKIKSETIFAKVEFPLGTKIGDEFMLSKPERLSLVGKDGKSTTPQKYTADDQEVKYGKRKVGDNKDGTIRLGNVAKAELDDEAVNLGQLNERLQNVKVDKVPYVSIKSTLKGTGSNYDSDGATGKDAIAIGPNAQASAEDSVAIGVGSKATENQATSLGHDAEATKLGSTAIGHGAKATGEDSYALGSQSQANEDMAVAIGFEAKANAADSFALGTGAKTNKKGSVALGADSVADTDKEVAGFDFGTNAQSTETSSTWKSTAGAVSVGGGKVNIQGKEVQATRQITNLAAGTKDTDAVNVAQLKTGTKNVVKYDSDENDKITLGGLDNSANPKVAGGVSITNLKAGDVSKDSKDAINGSQLYTTNESIKQNTTKITKNEGDITHINQKLVDFNKDSLFKVSNNGNNSQNIGLNGEIKFNAGDNIELTVSKDQKGANVEYKLMKDLTGVTSIKTNNQTYKFGFADPDEDAESVIRNKDLKAKNYVTSADLSKKADLDAKNLTNKTGNPTNTNETYVDVWKTALGIKDLTTNLTADLAGKANVNADNLSNDNVTSWQNKLGINEKADKTEITNLTTNINNKADKSDLTNLAKTDLTNITDAGKTTIKDLAKGSVEVVGDGDIVNVGKTTANDKDTYKVSVDATKLASNTTFITSLGDNFAKKDASNIVKSDWETALGLGEYVKTVTGDKFINVDSSNKQNPKLTLNTTDLANDSTFVTNIAGNQNFTTKLGDTFVTKTNLTTDLAGYTKLDGSNLATIAKNEWRDALGVKDSDIQTLAQKSVDVKAKTGSRIKVADKGVVNGKQTFEVGVDLTGLNGTTYNFAAGKNLTVTDDGNGNVKYSLNNELKDITSIENNGKTYTFGDTTLGDTSVITNKDLTEKGYVTASTQKTTSVSTEANSGIKVVDKTTGNNTDYKLSLDETKIKEITGTTNLTADLAGKANVNADNLSNDNVTSWQNKLGINEKADKTEITNLTTNINNKADKSDLTNLAKTDLTNITDAGKTTIKDLAKGSVEVVGDGDIVNVGKTTANDKDTYKVSVDATKLASNTTFITSLGDNFAKKDASNIVKSDWETALGLGEYVKTVTGDKFINVDSSNKQNPKLTLNTTDLANDSTFVTNIAGNQNFTTKLGDTFVTKTNLTTDLAGYTKLDGSNLATIAKNEWRDALGVKDSDIQTLAQKSVDVKAKTGSRIKVADKGVVNGKQTFEVGVDLTGLNGTTYNFAAGKNLTVTDDGNGNVKYSLNNELKDITSIENNGKTYTFGDTTLGDTSVITNKDLTEKGYVTASTQKTTSVSTEANSGIKVVDKTTGNNTDYKLSLDKDKVKEIAGTTSLTADLAGKADRNAGNLETADVTSWQNKLGINDKADKSDITNLTTNINNKADKTELTNLANKDLSNITNDGKTTIKNLAKGSVEVKAADGQDIVKVENTTPNTDKDTYTVSVNADKLAGSTAFSDNFAKKDASNIAGNKADWETALGLGEYVKSVTSTDNFIKVDDTNKQKPKLSLDTEKLASDKTFVTNIAGNNDFTKKLGDTFVTNTSLEAGYTKLDGSNLATIAKNTWRTALGVSDGDIKTLAQESVNVKAKDGSKVTVTDKTENGVKTFEVGVDLTGLNGTAYTFAAGENLTVEDKSGKVKYSLNKDLKNITSIENGGKTYTFGDATLGDTSVITNKDLETKGYVTADTQKTTSVSTEADSGIKVVSEATGKNTDYKLSLDKDKVKEIAGTTSLTADLAGKADRNAGNLETADVTSWQNKLGINDKADKTEITNLTTKIDSRNFISLSVTANGGSAKDEIKANENIDFTAKDGIKVAYDKNVNKFTFSADSSVIGGAFSNKYAMLDGSNLIATKGFEKDVWREALGLKNSDIADIFEGKNGISITQNGNKYTIGYVGGGTGTGGISKDEVETIIREYIGNNNMDSSKGSTDKIVTHNVSEQKITENKNIIAAINKINQEGIGFVHVNGGKIDPNKKGISENDSQANGNNSIAIGPKSQANRDNSIAIGLKSQANGENSIAIGVRNVVTGKNSGAFGDPSYIDGDDSYAIGNNNKINSNSKNTFILGNNVEVGAGMEGAVVLGNKSTADKATKESSAKVNGITYDRFAGQAKGEGMILSVGAKNAERQIKNVAAGEISKNSTDAVNGSQLYATNKIIGNVADSVKNVIGGNAKVNEDGKISASDIGGTGQKTINDAIRSINNNNTSGNKYIAINVPTKESVVPSVSEGSNSIAIGAGSSDDKRKNVVSVGNAKTGLNRTITNVAPGKYGTDAVNMNQLYGVAGGLSKQINDVKKKSSAGIAGAVALGMLPQSNIPGDALVSIGTGYHDSESAVALGISKTSDNARWIFKGGVSYDSQDEVTAGASVGFHF